MWLAAYLPRNNHSSSTPKVSATAALALRQGGEKSQSLSVKKSKRELEGNEI